MASKKSRTATEEHIRREIDRLDTEGEAVPRRVLLRLSRSGLRAAGALAQAATQDQRVRVRRWCTEGLGALRDRASSLALAAALKDANMSVRFHAVRTIARHGRHDLARPVIRLTTDVSPGVRHAAARALGALRCPGAGAALTRALADEKWHVRQAAAESLGQLRWRPAVSRLAELERDPRPAVRRAASHALRVISTPPTQKNED